MRPAVHPPFSSALGRLPAESLRLTVAGSLTMDGAYVDRLRGLVGRLGLVATVARHAP